MFLRSQHLAFIDRTNPALANRFVRRCRKYAVEQPWNGSRLWLCRIRKAMTTSDRAALEAYGGINGALTRRSVLADACAETRWSKAAITSGRTWRSKRVPEWTPAGRGAGEAA